MKILFGEDYPLERIAGIMHEMWVKHLGRQVEIGDTVYATGTIVTNSKNNKVGYLIDEDSKYFYLLIDIHKNKLVDVEPGDGWNDEGMLLSIYL